MSIRQFIFCDVCNPMAVRQIEERRAALRSGGRRRTDDRAWVEGSRSHATEQGWVATAEGMDVCGRCCERGLAERFLNDVQQPTLAPQSA